MDSSMPPTGSSGRSAAQLQRVSASDTQADERELHGRAGLRDGSAGRAGAHEMPETSWMGGTPADALIITTE